MTPKNYLAIRRLERMKRRCRPEPLDQVVERQDRTAWMTHTQAVRLGQREEVNNLQHIAESLSTLVQRRWWQFWR